jgi:hypothetical protein
MSSVRLLSAIDGWRNYWFRPAPLVDLAVVRIAAVGMQLLLLLFFHHLNFQRDYSSLPDEFYRPIPLLLLYIWPFGLDARPSFEVIEIVWAATLSVGVLALIGLRTNLSLLLFAAGSAFLQAHQWSYGDIHNPPAIMMIALGALALGPSGGALSIDAMRARTANSVQPWYARTSVFARWPILLVSWFFVAMYLSAGTSKVLASGFQWADGYTLEYYLGSDGVRNQISMALWLASVHPLLVLASWMVLILELTFGLALIVPKVRWIYIVTGFSFHVSCLLLLGAPFWEWMALYSVFVPWSAVFSRVWPRAEERNALDHVAQSV